MAFLSCNPFLAAAVGIAFVPELAALRINSSHVQRRFPAGADNHSKARHGASAGASAPSACSQFSLICGLDEVATRG